MTRRKEPFVRPTPCGRHHGRLWSLGDAPPRKLRPGGPTVAPGPAPRPEPSAAARERVRLFLEHGLPPLVLDPDEAGGLSTRVRFNRGKNFKGEAAANGFPPLEPTSAETLRELAVDLGAGKRWTR